MGILALEIIHTIPFQAGIVYVKILVWSVHCFNCGMPCLIGIISTFRGTWEQHDEILGALVTCAENNCDNRSPCEIQRPGMLIARTFGQVSLAGCTNEWHNCHSIISKMKIGPEATPKPPRHWGRPHRCSEVISDAPWPSWS